MQGGMRACPQCGAVNDSATETCQECDFNFSTGQPDGGPPPILAKGDVPRIVVDESNIKRAVARGPRRVIGIAVSIVVLIILGTIGYVVFAVKDSVDQTTDPFEFELPEGGTIEIPTDFGSSRTFTRSSCTIELQDALTQLLRRQAANEPLTGIFSDLTSWGVGSFEYGTLIKLYGDFETQNELASGRVRKSITMARRNATRACDARYP